MTEERNDAAQSTATWRDLFGSSGMKLLIVYCSGIWLYAADGLMVATMLPKIVPELGGAELIGWAGALFQALAIVSGAFSVFLVRRWHVSKAFYASVVGFALGCIMSGLAPNMFTFQIGRLVQAFCGGGLISIASIGVTQIFPTKLRIKAYALQSIVWGIAAFGAPLLGAVFAEYTGWRNGFFYAALIACIVGIAAIFAYRSLARKQPEVEEPNTEKLPIVRLLLLFFGVSCVATASLLTSSVMAGALVVIGLIATAIFVLRDKNMGPAALMPQGAFSAKRPMGQLMTFMFFASCATIAMGVFGPLLLADAFGISPISIGYLLFLSAAGWTLMAAILSGVSRAQEPMIIVLAAWAIAVSSPIIAWGFYAENLWPIAIGLFLDGAGFGACWGILFRRTTQHAVAHENERIASAISTVQRAGLAFGAAFLSIVCNQIGFSDVMSPHTAKQVGLIAMLASSIFGLPALWGAIKFASVEETQIHAASVGGTISASSTS